MKKYKETMLYLIFGVGTTVVNILVYGICARSLNLNSVLAACMAWLLSVLFAYVTNKIWVFESKVRGAGILQEMFSFFSCRMLTGILDVLLMLVCVNIWKWNDMAVKIFANILVVFLNYAAGKLLIFRERKSPSEKHSGTKIRKC